MRSHGCGDLRQDASGQAVELCGWVDRSRDHGGVIFVDLRDRSGSVQITVDPDNGAAMFAVAEHLRNETVIQVAGTVLAVADLSAEIHYHWLLDSLPRLGLALARSGAGADSGWPEHWHLWHNLLGIGHLFHHFHCISHSQCSLHNPCCVESLGFSFHEISRILFLRSLHPTNCTGALTSPFFHSLLSSKFPNS